MSLLPQPCEQPSKGSSEAHTRLVQAIRLRLGNRTSFPDLLIIQVVQGHMVDKRCRHYNTGTIAGFSDLFGLLSIGGGVEVWRNKAWHLPSIRRMALPFFLEVKTGRSRLSKVQRNFRDLAISQGAFFAVVRSVAEAEEALERVRRGESQ